MLLRLLFLVCLIFASLLSLSQESGTGRPHSPGFTGDTVVVPKVGRGFFVGDVHAASVFVVGDVHRPMGVVLEKTGHITVLQALATAEGPNPTANLHHAKILRKGENGRTEVPVDIKKIMQATAPDVALQADDILFVPHSASKSSMQKKEYFDHDVPPSVYYDVPPSAPLQDAAQIYLR
jgi:polysaccharide biosynthesis/export protein